MNNKPARINDRLTPESAYYSLQGPPEQNKADLKHILSDLKYHPGEWGMTPAEESMLAREVMEYLGELED